MRHEFGRNVADAVTRKRAVWRRAVENEIRAPGQIERGARDRFVHRQNDIDGRFAMRDFRRGAVTTDAALVTERLAQRRTERERAVLDRVVLVDMRIAFTRKFQRKTAMLADLFEHVIKEAKTGTYLGLGHTIEIDLHRDARLFGIALDR